MDQTNVNLLFLWNTGKDYKGELTLIRIIKLNSFGAMNESRDEKIREFREET